MGICVLNLSLTKESYGMGALVLAVQVLSNSSTWVSNNETARHYLSYYLIHDSAVMGRKLIGFPLTPVGHVSSS